MFGREKRIKTDYYQQQAMVPLNSVCTAAATIIDYKHARMHAH